MRILLLALLTVSCGGSTGSEPVAATDAGTPRVPKVHRTAVVACPATRDPGQASSPEGTCTKDGDCTAGRNGRCYGGLRPNSCSYDECAADADCRAAVCDCRNVGTIGQPNKCFPGNCRTDADCGKQFCSPSGTDVAAGCTGAELGSYGYFCHTAADECVDDADCNDVTVTRRCLFDPDVVHWKCKRLLCPR